jgi:hypothetical protein
MEATGCALRRDPVSVEWRRDEVDAIRRIVKFLLLTEANLSQDIHVYICSFVVT